MLYNIKALYLHCVFHGIRFKVNNEDWLSVTDSLFLFYSDRLFLEYSVCFPIFPVWLQGLVSHAIGNAWAWNGEYMGIGYFLIKGHKNKRT